MPSARGKKERFFKPEAWLQRCSCVRAKCGNPAEISRICLECAAIFSHLPLTIRCRLGDYTRAMMIKRILTICAVLTVGAAGTSQAQTQGYPMPPGAVYSPYPQGGTPDYRRAPGVPDFDALEDDEGPNGQESTALPPPGSPPVYSD